MNPPPTHPTAHSRQCIRRRGRNRTRRFFEVGSAIALFMGSTLIPMSTSYAHARPAASVAHVQASGTYPVGTPDHSEPSGQAPPAPDALVGYTQTYVNDFNAPTLPTGWNVFTGIPGADPGAHFGISHVTVSGGVLRLLTYRNRSWHNRWVTGGVCQCGLAQTYGADFVRSRVTGAGPNEAELLWPSGSTWPPEIDFSESGGSLTNISSSLHYGSVNHIDQRFLHVNMRQWHTWGVIWTPTSVIYTVDGRIWSSVTVLAEIPTLPMTLDLEQRTKCAVGHQCPTKPVAMEVDWVAEYSTRVPTTTTTTNASTTTTSTEDDEHDDDFNHDDTESQSASVGAPRGSLAISYCPVGSDRRGGHDSLVNSFVHRTISLHVIDEIDGANVSLFQGGQP